MAGERDTPRRKAFQSAAQLLECARRERFTLYLLDVMMPETALAHHGYGCLSIRTIAQLHRGLCEFGAENGIFTLRVALPM